MANVLLLEDNSDLLNVVQEALELSGHVVHTALTGQQGLTALTQGNFIPDAIICDIMMPDMDGLTFLRHVRADQRFAGVFFIVVSGNGGDRETVLSAGANEYLAKPFSIVKLNALIDGRGSR